MEIKKLPKSWLIYAVPMAVAGLVRIIFYSLWLESPFRYYHTLYGLDMRKFILWGENFYNGREPFSMYKCLVGCLYGIVGKEHLVEAVVLTQMLLGVLITGMTVYIFRHIFRNSWGAAIAGLLSALYAPFLIYETQVLKETLFLFLCLSALTAVVTLRRKHFSPIYSYISGILLIAPFFLRSSGILLGVLLLIWVFLYCLKKKRSLNPLLFIFMGIATLMSIVAGFNLKNHQSNANYFTPNTPYLLEVGAEADIHSLSIQEDRDAEYKSNEKGFVNYILHYLSKPGYIFSGYEKPNNVNYYFEKQKLPFLRYLPGPLLIIPLSVAGILLLILNFRKNSRISILLLYMLAFIVPMMLFVPLARYKIVLIPVFTVFAGYWVYYIFQSLKKGEKSLLVKPLFLFLGALVFSGYFCRELPKRKSDIKSYGLATSHIPHQLMGKGDFQKAEDILEKYYMENPKNSFIMLNYVSSLLGTRQADKAKRILHNHTTIEEPALVGRYCYELAECAYMLGNKADAIKYYYTAIQYPISQQRLQLAKARIQLLKKEDVTHP